MAKNVVSKFVSKLMKKFKFLTKKSNINKVLFLVLVLLALFMLHRYALGGFEGFESSPESLESDLAEGEGKKLVMFYASWCPHCKALLTEGDKPWANAENEVNVDGAKKMIRIDTGDEGNESHMELNKNHGVNGFPTIFVFENGEKVSEYEGERTKEKFIEFFGEK